MKNKLLCLVVLFLFISSYFIPVEIKAQGETFTKRTVANGFNSAWEVVYGPNDSLWVTENVAYTVSRVNIANGAKTQLIDLSSNKSTFTSGSWPQGGLMGLAIHPNLYSTDPTVRAAKPWVYVAFVFNKVTPNSTCATPGTVTGCKFYTRIVRYVYSGNTLSSPTIVLDSIPGSSDHNSGRLVIGPTIESGSDAAHTQYRLYYTVGDMGCGQFANTNRTENAQNVDVMEGKSLRINTESDGDPGKDAWVPNDNPFYNATITPKCYVYTMGHRNPQGLAWGFAKSSPTTNILYSSEQMDRSDDEINILSPSMNYGWDKVSGFCDGNVNGYKIGQTVSANEQAFCTGNSSYQDPIFEMWYAPASSMAALFAQSNNLLWPTVALSSIEFYGYNVIPNWPNSVLVSPLKDNKVYRLKLKDDGSGVATGTDTISYFVGDGNRVRRIRAAPDGLKFYVARDVGATSNGGTIMEYTYTGSVLAIIPNNDTTYSNARSQIRVFPNPTSGIINIQGKRGLSKPLQVQIYDITGRLLKQTTSDQNNFQVDISSFSPGTYLLKLLNGEDIPIDTEKIIKH